MPVLPRYRRAHFSVLHAVRNATAAEPTATPAAATPMCSNLFRIGITTVARPCRSRNGRVPRRSPTGLRGAPAGPFWGSVRFPAPAAAPTAAVHSCTRWRRTPADLLDAAGRRTSAACANFCPVCSSASAAGLRCSCAMHEARVPVRQLRRQADGPLRTDVQGRQAVPNANSRQRHQCRAATAIRPVTTVAAAAAAAATVR
jgi:hypothetical protein